MQTRSRGFTLIELVVALAIVAILATIAYPSYIGQVVKTRRAAGAACLMEQAQFMERYYATNPNLTGYTGAALPNTACEADLNGHYVIAFSVVPNANSYTIAATPQGAQWDRDTQCRIMSVNERGTKSVSGSYSATPSNCF